MSPYTVIGPSEPGRDLLIVRSPCQGWRIEHRGISRPQRSRTAVTKNAAACQQVRLEAPGGLIGPAASVLTSGSQRSLHRRMSNNKISNRNVLAAQSMYEQWGGRGSNPRPRDYESPALTG
jgi:hypothetical protein